MLEKFFSMDSNEEVEEALVRGRKLLEGKFYDRAMVEFRKALELDHETAMPVITEIYRQSSGDPAALISLGTNLLAHDKDNVELMNLLANAYRKLENREQAKKLYQRCLEVDPRNEFATYNLAATIARADYEDSSAVSAIKPFEGMSSFRLPAPVRDTEEIQQIFEKSQPEPIEKAREEEAEQGGSSFVDDLLEGPEQAAAPPATPKKPAATAPQDRPKVDPELVQKEIAAAEPDAARRAVLSLDVALYCIRENAPEAARALLEDLIKQDPKNVDLRSYLICVLAGAHLDKALELMGKLLHVSPRHRSSLVNYGLMLRKQGKASQARVYFFQAAVLLERSKGEYDLSVILEAARTELGKGSKKKFLELLEPLVDELTQIELLLQLSNLQLEGKSFEAAIQTIRRAAGLEAKHPEVLKARRQLYQTLIDEADNSIKKEDLEKATWFLDQAIGFRKDPATLRRAIVLYNKLENEKRSSELRKLLEEVELRERNRQIKEKTDAATNFEAEGNFVQALKAYEEAILIEPRNELLSSMLEVTEKMQRPELQEKLTEWFHGQKEEWAHKKQEADDAL
jgi:tetratricopeptide (TPR) repeat protein